MVVGGMVLLAIGAIRLEAAPAVATSGGEQAPPDALVLEFKKMVKVRAHYPALALFLIGVLFIFASAWLSKPERVEPWTILGKIQTPDPNAVTIEVVSDNWATLSPNSDGTIDTLIYPNVSKIRAVVHASGCKPETQHLLLKVTDAKKHILELNAAAVEKIADKPAGTQIAKLPDNVQLPPLTSAGTFN